MIFEGQRTAIPEIPFPKKKTLWPLVLVPLSMGISYLLIAFPRFSDDPMLIFQHLFILSFWLISMFFFMMVVRNVLIKLHMRFIVLPAIIIPVLGCYLLYIIYLCAVIGNTYWGSPPCYIQILPFIPHLFELLERFHIPGTLLIAILVLPMLGLALIFQGRMRNMIIWHWSLQESYILMEPKHRRNWTLFVSACWLGAFWAISTADPSIPGFLNFSHDPIITFFKVKPTLFAMTQERVFWAQRDKQVELMTRGHVPKVHNVFLFVADALRADHLLLYGYQRPLTPYFSSFLSNTHMRKIDLALSTGIDTITGTVCLMTSKEPAAMSAFDYTLPDYFYDQGFKTQLILAGDHHWQLQHEAFGKKIDLFYDGSEHPGPGGVCDDDLVLDWVNHMRPDDGGYHFFYIHLISVHPLGTFKDEFLKYKPTRSIIIDDTPFFGQTLPYVINRYDDRILQLDSVLKKLFTALGNKGYLKDYVALMTADHGQILGEKGRYGHGRFVDITGLKVPMIFFGSKALPPFPETRYAGQMDVAPTLADLAGVDYPPCWQGQSLLRPRKNPWSYHLSPYSHPKQEGAVTYYSPDKIYKFSRRLDPEQQDQGQLFELISDPLEEKNLLGQVDPSLLGQMRSQANEHFTNF